LVTDVWKELQQVFGLQVEDLYPGIKVNGLDHQSQKTILNHIFENVAEIDPLLEDITTGYELYPSTLDSLLHHMVSDDVDGMVWIGLKADGMTLPPLGLFTPNCTSLSIHYISGMWTPVSLIGLMEFLRWVHDLDVSLYIEMEEETAPKSLCKQFDKTWQTYLKDKNAN
jgi:hypothetical protein